MSPRRSSGRRILKAVLPVALLFTVAVSAFVVWVVYGAVRPPRRAYLITPEGFRQLSDRGLKVTDETWTNRDGTGARGWLLRGREGAPAVILLHSYGADRSWFLNLGVKLNEASDVTVLWPDLRGHGPEPPVATTSFGVREAEDVLAALEYLRGLKSQGRPLVGRGVGLYGVGMGAYAALMAAREAGDVRALALDSVPASPDDVLRRAVEARTGLNFGLLQALARAGVRVYSLGGYQNRPACSAAEELGGRKVLLLSGEGAGPLRDTTGALARCFPPAALAEVQTDLQLTGFTLASATPEEGEAYDRRVIEFFNRTLNK